MTAVSNWAFTTTWRDAASNGTYVATSGDARLFISDKDAMNGSITLDNTWERDFCRRGYNKVSALEWLDRRIREICDCWKG